MYYYLRINIAETKRIISIWKRRQKKKIGKRRPKKQKNTQEELDMIRSGLINVFNPTIINYREIKDVYKRQVLSCILTYNILCLHIYFI